MPFSHISRVRGSRHRLVQKSPCSCTCGSAFRSSSFDSCADLGWDGPRQRGTTLGYVKCTWSELVSRCDRSKDDMDGGHDDGDSSVGLGYWSRTRRRSSGGLTMVKRRPVKSPQDTSATNNNNNNNHKHLPKGKSRTPPPSSSSFLTSQWVNRTTLLKAAVLVLIAAVAPVVILNDFGFKRNGSESSPSSRTVKNNGGWRLADSETVTSLDSDYCNIDRVSVRDLGVDRFEREYRYKKPVIMTFPRGASDWTVPEKWSLDDLKRSYGEWAVSSGSSVEIVRRGGNGDVVSSFDEFTSSLMQERQDTAGTPRYYMFDRLFFRDSELHSTLKLPPYFSTDMNLNDGIFFLGASGSGVVFHKHADTWNAVVFGRKRWFLYPMTNTPPGGVHHGYNIMDWYTRVYPNLTGSQRPLECAQQGGEILYLPEGFYHATINIGDTIAVALQKKEPVLEEEILTYEVAELNKKLDGRESDQKKVHKKLLTTLLKLQELLPGSTEVMMKLGEKYGDLGQHEKAIDTLQKTIDIDPYFVLAYTALGNNLASMGRVEEAEEALTRAVKLSPELWDIYRDYGLFLLRRARYQDAVPVLRKGAELSPDSIPFWSYLRIAQENSGDFEGARETQMKVDELVARQK